MNNSAKFILFSIIFILLSFITTPSFAESTPKTKTIGGIEFVYIEGGSFVMGDILRKDKNASPPHRVNVGDFWIGKYEVTFDHYDKFCKATNRKKPSDEGWGRGNRPVINVSWIDATAFTDWLSKQTGQTIRLPSESEWEYAARGGTGTRYWWGNNLEFNLANCDGCNSTWDNKMTAPVGTFNPNPSGLHDTSGNVYEWCIDTLHEDYEGAPSDGSAWLSGKTDVHINRGGSWFMPFREIANHKRAWDKTETKNNLLGFRILLEKE